MMYWAVAIWLLANSNAEKANNCIVFFKIG